MAWPRHSPISLLLPLLLLITTASSTQPQQPSHRHHTTNDNYFRRLLISISLGIATGLAAAFLLASLLRFLFCYINRTPILKGPVVFSPKIQPKSLLSSLHQELPLLGSSSNGNYHKLLLDETLPLALKRLNPFDIGGGSPESLSKSSLKRETQHQLELLAGLRHRNLMSLRAYIREPDRFSLVYDYVPTGSLQDAMDRVRQSQLQLSWEVRLHVALGIVKALRYLHFECAPQILHFDLKPTNVILDAEFEPRLTDCGLSGLLPNLDRASSGYNAPECFQNCRYTDKSDIFSFGMIMAVLLTGRDPKDPFFGEGEATGGSLGCWLRHLQQAGEAKEALDKSIIGEEGEEDEMLMAVRIAVVCLSDLPQDRPSSDELVLMLSQLHSF
ncbi:unnamed protein product [Linum trigynum]|uniref:Protein kinase domain-containing protein n=1 Tax=Linum trigynum TaxID=586398 RepID=A0AAV2CGT3_9ROSI